MSARDLVLQKFIGFLFQKLDVGAGEFLKNNMHSFNHW